MDSDDPSSASCRIIVVSSSLETSREVATRIKALSGDSSDAQPTSEVIHWTIKNKYYTAPVHFHPIHLEGLESIELDDVPAVIYTWKENEPYRTHLKHVSEHTSPCKPEVSLAINLAPHTEEELEDFFFEHGFEYIDGHSSVHKHPISLSDSTATPGFHRALDALSTIMWPSMVRAEPVHSRLAAQRVSPADLAITDETDIDFQTLMNASASNLTSDEGKSNMQREMEKLEKWLEQDDDNNEGGDGTDDNDYASLYSHAQSISTVKSEDPWSTGMYQSIGTPKDTHGGFDDDFTDFVSAPPAGRSVQNAADVPDDDSDPELPSRADILAASARIFGSSTSPSSSSAPFTALPGSPLSITNTLPSDDVSGMRRGSEINPDRELDMDVPAFDLSRILGALEGMKEDISHISDEQERRKAAAKAALGLVYGLDGTSEKLDFESDRDASI
ncbi:hypothetical protein DFH11DRAFT_1594625 [Phellopilus nigrolimitatus]|nr:hypothetical protein DFH11DRAFT_1594625 [Phellopilus nigrolimitatus]